MKKVFIGGFLTLSGMIGTVALIAAAGSSLTSAWVTPPGRLLTTILENGFSVPLLLSLILLILGFMILGKEYFQKG